MKRKKKCRIVVALIMAICVSGLLNVKGLIAASTPRVTKSVSLDANTSKKLSIVKNGFSIKKIRVTSSNPLVATTKVKKKAVTVKGITPGKTFVKVVIRASKKGTTKNYTSKCKVIVHAADDLNLSPVDWVDPDETPTNTQDPGIAPTVSPNPVESAMPTGKPIASATPSPKVTSTPTPAASRSPSATPSVTPTPTTAATSTPQVFSESIRNDIMTLRYAFHCTAEDGKWLSWPHMKSFSLVNKGDVISRGLYSATIQSDISYSLVPSMAFGYQLDENGLTADSTDDLGCILKVDMAIGIDRGTVYIAFFSASDTYYNAELFESYQEAEAYLNSLIKPSIKDELKNFRLVVGFSDPVDEVAYRYSELSRSYPVGGGYLMNYGGVQNMYLPIRGNKLGIYRFLCDIQWKLWPEFDYTSFRVDTNDDITKSGIYVPDAKKKCLISVSISNGTDSKTLYFGIVAGKTETSTNWQNLKKGGVMIFSKLENARKALREYKY